MYSRISFLYQAAAYLASSDEQAQTRSDQKTRDAAVDVDMNDAGDKPAPAAQNMSRRLLGQLRATTLKSQIRISPDIKRTICKYCDTLLVQGQTCSSLVENRSKGGKKPWADTLVVKCHTCGREKRFPVNAPRQKRRTLRASADLNKAAAVQKEHVPPPRPQEEHDGS